jgi:hypothetical protein
MNILDLHRHVSIVLALALLASFSAWAQQEESKSKTGSPESESVSDGKSDTPNLEDLAALSVPSEPHELLATTVGTWDVTIRIWTDPEPGAEPASMAMGTAVGRWILGERFVETIYEGEVLGRPFEGLKIEGFDKAEERYVSTWRDNLGTYTLVFKGACEDSCKERVMSSSFLEPVSKQTFRIKGVTTITDEDAYNYESFVITPNGQEFKNMELDARRRK